jgi:hypothetical protein
MSTNSQAQAQAQQVDSNILKAKEIFDGLQEDIQKQLMNDYIKPEVDESKKLLTLFQELIESDECSELKYDCLIDPVTKIIQNPHALAEIRKLNLYGFDYIYKQHFIKKENTFSLVHCPYTSMCMEFVMRRWH